MAGIGLRLGRARVAVWSAWALLLPAVCPASDGHAQGKPAHDQVSIAGRFAIDRHEVTIGQFRSFVRDRERITKAERDGGGMQYLAGWEQMRGWTWAKPFGHPGGDLEPAVHLTWDEAHDYCRWAGYRLPTDAEWVEAAYVERRPAPPEPFVTGRTYPYPTGADPDAANHIRGSLPPSAFLAAAGRLDRGRGHVPVKTTKPGVNGLYDMGANVWEWIDHEIAGRKRTRGGSWWYGPPQMRAAAHYEKPRDFPAVYIGFRCARSLP